MLNKELLLFAEPVDTIPYIVVGVDPNNSDHVGYDKRSFGENHNVYATYNGLSIAVKEISGNYITGWVRVSIDTTSKFSKCLLTNLDSNRTLSLRYDGAGVFFLGMDFFKKTDVGKKIHINVRLVK